MSDETEKAPETPSVAKQEVDAFDRMAKDSPRYTMFILWLTVAGLWQTGECLWVILRGIARLIA